MKIKTYVELELEVNADYTPERSAPACQNHDSPRFSDSGDSEELEITEMAFIIRSGKTILARVPVPSDLADHVAEKIESDVLEQCRNQVDHASGRDIDHLDLIKDTIKSMHDIRKLAGYR